MVTASKIQEAARTDLGRVRETNEDAFGTVEQPPAAVCDLLANSPDLLTSKGRLYIVCDGVGGYAAGEVASQMAVEIIFREYYSDPAPQPADRLRRAIAAANTAIHELASSDATKQKMASTVVAAVVGPAGGQLTIAHAGDSRAYLYRDGRLRQLTQDHSWVAEQMRANILTPAQARRHAYRNVITRALGVAAEVNIEVNENEQLRPGDVLLLCSDGLHSEVAGDRITAILRTAPDIKEAATRLVAEARKQGGHDNITVVLVTLPQERQGDQGATITVPRVPYSLMPLMATLLGGIVLILVACLVSNPGLARLGGIFAPTPTPTATVTPSPTETPKPTSTLAPTRTPTPTDTPTPTKTFTSTPTNTPTNTSTSTPTRTSTPTLTPTRTFTPVPTATRTLTYTPVLKPTMTHTPTPTPAPALTSTTTTGQPASRQSGRSVCCPSVGWLPLAIGLMGALRQLKKSGLWE